MKYTGMPTGMWLLFSGSFRKQLEEVLGYSREEACKITVNAKRQYRKLIGKLPEFERLKSTSVPFEVEINFSLQARQ